MQRVAPRAAAARRAALRGARPSRSSARRLGRPSGTASPALRSRRPCLAIALVAGSVLALATSPCSPRASCPATSALPCPSRGRPARRRRSSCRRCRARPSEPLAAGLRVFVARYRDHRLDGLQRRRARRRRRALHRPRDRLRGAAGRARRRDAALRRPGLRRPRARPSRIRTISPAASCGSSVVEGALAEVEVTGNRRFRAELLRVAPAARRRARRSTWHGSSARSRSSSAIPGSSGSRRAARAGRAPRREPAAPARAARRALLPPAPRAPPTITRRPSAATAARRGLAREPDRGCATCCGRCFQGSEGLLDVEARYEIPRHAVGHAAAPALPRHRDEDRGGRRSTISTSKPPRARYGIELAQPLWRSEADDLARADRRVPHHRRRACSARTSASSRRRRPATTRPSRCCAAVSSGRAPRRSDVFAVRSLLSVGIDALGATTHGDASVADGRFVAWLGQAQWAHVLPEALWGTQTVLRVDTQLADDPLLSIERFAIGGRAACAATARTSSCATTAWSRRASCASRCGATRCAGPLLELVPFLDYGYGWNKGFEPPDDTLLGLGVGLRFTPLRWLLAEIYWGGRLEGRAESERRSPGRGRVLPGGGRCVLARTALAAPRCAPFGLRASCSRCASRRRRTRPLRAPPASRRRRRAAARPASSRPATPRCAAATRATRCRSTARPRRLARQAARRAPGRARRRQRRARRGRGRRARRDRGRARRGGEPPPPAQPPAEAAQLLVNLARTWQQLGAREPARAAVAAQRAVALLQQADALARRRGDARLRSYAQGYLGELYLAGGRSADARTLTRRALFEASARQRPRRALPLAVAARPHRPRRAATTPPPSPPTARR